MIGRFGIRKNVGFVQLFADFSEPLTSWNITRASCRLLTLRALFPGRIGQLSLTVGSNDTHCRNASMVRRMVNKVATNPIRAYWKLETVRWKLRLGSGRRTLPRRGGSFFAVDFGEGGIEGFANGLEAIVDFPPDVEHQGDSARTVDGIELANSKGLGKGTEAFFPRWSQNHAADPGEFSR